MKNWKSDDWKILETGTNCRKNYRNFGWKWRIFVDPALKMTIIFSPLLIWRNYVILCYVVNKSLLQYLSEFEKKLKAPVWNRNKNPPKRISGSSVFHVLPESECVNLKLKFWEKKLKVESELSTISAICSLR